MSQSEVFRPSNGPLLVRGSITEGPRMSCDVFKKKPSVGSRPSTQGGYRFGQLSHNSFFARHNPQPGRVRHIKGLLDVPICSVNDDGYFANPRYSLNFPPSNFDQTKLTKSSKSFNMPVNAINVNSNLHPINTVTGLQNFLGKPLNFRVFREKAIPKMGMVPVTEAWRDELRALTEACGLAPANQLPKPPRPATMETGRPRTSNYSMETGRLIPPPSRAMSRGQSRAASRAGFVNKLQHITEDPDRENMVLQMLCQILQTDDVNAVQSWLVSAGDREKSMVLDMIRSALSGGDEYYTQHQAEYVEPKFNPLDTIGGDNADRLTLDRGSPLPRSPAFPMNSPQNGSLLEDVEKPAFPDVFQRANMTASGNRPGSGLAIPASSEAKLRYTMTPVRDQNITSQKAGLSSFLDNDNVWNQDQAI